MTADMRTHSQPQPYDDVTQFKATTKHQLYTIRNSLQQGHLLLINELSEIAACISGTAPSNLDSGELLTVLTAMLTIR